MLMRPRLLLRVPPVVAVVVEVVVAQTAPAIDAVNLADTVAARSRVDALSVKQSYWDIIFSIIIMR